MLRMHGAGSTTPQVPAMYKCPLTMQPMEDPVILVESGAIFERQAIQARLASGSCRCPHSHIMLPSSNGKAAVMLLPADDLRKVIPHARTTVWMSKFTDEHFVPFSRALFSCAIQVSLGCSRSSLALQICLCDRMLSGIMAAIMKQHLRP